MQAGALHGTAMAPERHGCKIENSPRFFYAKLKMVIVESMPLNAASYVA